MKKRLATPRSSALISVSAITGFLAVLPLMLLELVNRRTFNDEFPFALFGCLWLLATLFMVILMPCVRDVRAGNTAMANPAVLFLRGVVLVVIAWLLGTSVIDQLPCFLGVPNCD